MYVTHIEKMRNAYRFWWKTEGKKPLGRPRHGGEDIETDLK
jgi:hypothetical protein